MLREDHHRLGTAEVCVVDPLASQAHRDCGRYWLQATVALYFVACLKNMTDRIQAWGSKETGREVTLSLGSSQGRVFRDGTPKIRRLSPFSWRTPPR
jgi:hypothetical protein